MLRARGMASRAIRRWGFRAEDLIGGRELGTDDLSSILWAVTGINGLVLGDLPPREGLTWLIQWEGRTWPSSCGGVSTDLLFSCGGRSWFILRGRVPAANPDGMLEMGPACIEVPEDLTGLFGTLTDNPALLSALSEGAVALIPFTNMTVEYLNLLFIYAARGYPFRFVDVRTGGVIRLPSLVPEEDTSAFDFSLYELEQRVLSLLAVEQGFMLVNVAKAASGRRLVWTGLELADGSWVEDVVLRYLKPGRDIQLFTLPFYSSTDEAVEAYLEYKWSGRQEDAVPYRNGTAVLAEISYPSHGKIRRVKDFCRAVYENHGRLPVYLPVLYGGMFILVGRPA